MEKADFEKIVKALIADNAAKGVSESLSKVRLRAANIMVGSVRQYLVDAPA